MTEKRAVDWRITGVSFGNCNCSYGGGRPPERAEIGSATTRARGRITLDLKDSYGQFNLLDHSGRGVVHAA
jgi:hypothetical protein